jgi:hypothetical protein
MVESPIPSNRAERPDPPRAAAGYQPPAVERLGNLRDLLHGASQGNPPDTSPFDVKP